MTQGHPPARGRGSADNPPNRFERLAHVPEPDAEDAVAPETLFLRDRSRTVIAHNDSPDVGFEYSINPYRGCEHGCAYCYARPTHEFLGFSAGLDFESKILVKEDAPELLRRELGSVGWEPRGIAVSGVTDAYQPIERRLQLTRRCLAVLAEFRNPVVVITKNQLVTRDVDLLAGLATVRAAAAFLSVTTLDPHLAGLLEPRASRPCGRLAAIETLARAGVPAGVMVAPVIPGLNDHEIPSILAACSQAGATFAGYTLLRLPLAVGPLFERWLERHVPEKKARILGRVRDLHGGKLNDARFHHRMHGRGAGARLIADLFRLGCRRAGVNKGGPRLSTAAFRRPGRTQRLLFADPPAPEAGV